MTGGTETNSRSVLILGAASDIGRAIAREYGRAGRPVILSARNPERLQADVSDLRIRFSIPVRTEEFDVLKTCNHDAFLDRLGELPQTVVCVIGLLGNQLRAEADAAHADLIIRTNFVGPAAILALVANRMAARGAGVIVGVSSVAGDRGRATNYVYGAAKAGFTVFLSGLRNRLVACGIQVVTVKPGFVRTRMTEGMRLPEPLTATPEEVARAILAAERRGRDVIYVRPVWRPIMTIIRLLPEPLFKRLRL
jgi:decaprenylphospho-beta-D-erythro-pentofuranosid-2-ulose 2-reductase